MLKGDRLRQLRQEQGYTHETLAKALGLSMKQVWRYEAGQSDPTSEVVSRMAVLFGVSADYLLGLSDSPAMNPAERSLTPRELAVLTALRRGDKLTAIRAIVNED